MDWSDDGIVVSARLFGDSGRIVKLLTRGHGLHAGLVRGRRASQQLQPGTHVAATWRARLADHLGAYVLEATTHVAGEVMDRPLRLSALASACSIVESSLPERAPYPTVFDGLAALLALLDGEAWDAAYVQWEVGLLGALGFGLDLSRCAVTGAAGRPNDRLAYVSPRSGRAVLLSASEPYRDRLLPLPGFLVGEGEAGGRDVLDGLALTGHFLDRLVFAQADRACPPARQRYVEAYRRAVASSGSLPAS